MNDVSSGAVTELTVPTVRAKSYVIYGKLIMVALFWGGTFPAIRVVSQALPDLSIIPAAIRCAIAVILLFFLARNLEGGLPRLSGQQLAVTVALGATGFFLNIICMFAAMAYIPAGRAALIVALNPIVTAVALAIFFHERLGIVKWCGIAVAFLGAAVVITRGDLQSAFGDISASVGMGELLMFGGVSFWVAFSIIGRHAMKGLSPLAATAYAAMWGTMLLLISSIIEWQKLDVSQVTWQVIAALVYLGSFGTVIGTVWYYEGIREIGASRAAIFNNLVPVFGIALSVFFLNEDILKSMIVGGILVVIGVALTNR